MSKQPLTKKVKLDFDQARVKHFLFKTRLRSILYGADIDEAPVVSHLECTVGKWIYSHALEAYGSIPQMQLLEKVHADLHISAARLVEQYKSGEVEEARKGLEGIEAISSQLGDLLTVVQQKVEEAHLEPDQEPELAYLNNGLQELHELQRLSQDLDKRIWQQSKEVYEAKERFELLAKATQDAIWDWNMVTNQVWWNDGFRHSFGHNREETASGEQVWKTLIHPEDRERVLHSIEEFITSAGKQWTAEYRFQRADGSFAIVSNQGYALHNDKGTPYRMVGAMRDITRERKQTESALAQSEERFRTLAENIQNLAWMANADGWIYWYNQRWYEYTGTTLEEMQGWGWEKVHHPHHVGRVMEYVKAAWHKEEPWELTFPLRGKDGRYRWFLTRVFPVKNEEGKVVQWIGTNTDIDEQKRTEVTLEEKVRERTLELENKNRELEQFAYAASHDMQEPLRKIGIFSNFLLEHAASQIDTTGKNYLQKINASVARMRTIIEDLLQYSQQARAGQQHIPTDLNAIMETIKADLDLAIQQKGAQIRIDQLPQVLGAPGQLYQLFYNLITNALKFTSPEKIPQIQINATEPIPEQTKAFLRDSASKPLVQISVRDNGIGFHQEHAQQIFSLFKRLHGRSEYEGTGIGLALCKKIVENHGGTIWAEGKPGEGATFHLLLPVPQKMSGEQ